jgi:hypothetical protein
MPAIAPIPPWAMKEILHLFGFQVIAEDEYNWVLSETKDHLGVAEAGEKEPIILPKLGDELALDVMMSTVINAKLDLHTYFALKAKVYGSMEPLNLTDAVDDSTVN